MNWPSYLAGGFYGHQSRILKDINSESLMHALLLYVDFVENNCNLIQNTLSLLWSTTFNVRSDLVDLNLLPSRPKPSILTHTPQRVPIMKKHMYTYAVRAFSRPFLWRSVCKIISGPACCKVGMYKHCTGGNWHARVQKCDDCWHSNF